MGKTSKGFITGIYRPQMPKRNGGNRRHRTTAKNNVVMVDKVKEMVKNCRTEKMILSNTPRDVQQRILSKVENYQFNKGRPSIDKQERRMVKRNLFGVEEKENDRRSSVNRKLRAKLKAKKKLFRSDRHAGRSSKCVDGQQSVLSERVLSWVSKHHPRSPITSAYQIPHQLEPSPNFLTLEQHQTSFFARKHLSPIPAPGPSWNESSQYQFSSSVSHEFWRGSTSRESFTDEGHRLLQESSKSIATVSPVTNEFGRCSPNLSFSSNFSFQDNKLFSSSYSNIDNGSIPSINFQTSSSSESWFNKNWLPEDECVHGSPMRNEVARVMWGAGGIPW